MTGSDLYKELGELTRNKDRWEEGIPCISSLLSCDSVKIQAKALWLPGEMGPILSFGEMTSGRKYNP